MYAINSEIDSNVVNTTSHVACSTQGNGLDKIEGLDNQKEMRTLYLQENIINKIENMEALLKLDTLNISKNFVSKIENLSHMKLLRTLIISNNNLTDAASIKHVVDIPGLHALDIQSNKIDDDPEKILSVLENCKEVRLGRRRQLALVVSNT